MVCVTTGEGGFTEDGFNFPILLVGYEFGRFGAENKAELEISDDRLATVMADTKRRLKEGGFAEPPALFFHFEAEFLVLLRTSKTSISAGDAVIDFQHQDAKTGPVD